MANHAPPENVDSKANIAEVPTISHAESNQEHSKFKSAKNADGDTAMALFDDPDELHEAVDPVEARKLLWKIDFMILPYLAVCYAFFYIDKVSQSLWLRIRWKSRANSVHLEIDNAELCCYFWNPGRSRFTWNPV